MGGDTINAAHTKTLITGRFGHEGAYFNIAPFDTNSLAIYQGTLDPIVNTGDLVGPEHFGSFPVTAFETPWILWQANDGSSYDWFSTRRRLAQ